MPESARLTAEEMARLQLKGFQDEALQIIGNAITRGSIHPVEMSRVLSHRRKFPDDDKKAVTYAVVNILKNRKVRFVSPLEVANRARSTHVEDGERFLSATNTNETHRLLKQYLNEVGQYPLLPDEEMHALVRDYQQTGSEQARNKLIKHNLRLPVSIAKRYAHRVRTMTLLDLIQEGNFGLMHALTKYNPDRGFKFTTYATWWVKQGIIRVIANRERVVRVPVHLAESIAKVKKVRREAGRDVAAAWSHAELALRCNLTLSAAKNAALELLTRTIPFDKLLAQEANAPTSYRAGELQVASTTALGPEERITAAAELEDLREKLDIVYAVLSEEPYRKKKIFCLQHGLNGSRTPLTLEEVGDKMGLSRERIRQITAAIWIKIERRNCGFTKKNFEEKLRHIEELGTLAGVEVVFTDEVTR